MESDSRFKRHGDGDEHRSLDNLSKGCRRRQLLCQCDATNPNKGLVEARGVEGIALSRRRDL